jgi:hypothetical protein
MNAKQIESKFAEMGARFKVLETASPWNPWDRRGERRGDYAMDLQRDRHGQFFELRVPQQLSDKLDATVMQSEPQRRHLLLLVRRLTGEALPDRFLCGHDEREWFVAAVPGGASSVRQAMDTLQPDAVREALAREQVSWSRRHARKNPAFRRQGEWFFLPEPSFKPTRSSFSATNRSAAARASPTSPRNFSAAEGRPFTSAPGTRMASGSGNTAGCCSGTRRPPPGAGGFCAATWKSTCAAPCDTRTTPPSPCRSGIGC